MKLIWDIYEIESDADTLHGVMLRGRIRKFVIEHCITCLTENASDKKNVVRFALLTGTDPSSVTKFTQEIIPGVAISKVMGEVENPVLSKLKVNDLTRYSIG
jgi:hypothetical protein